MVGGTGEQRTLRTLAMHGDIMNVDGWSGRGMSFELYQHKVSVLERHCEKVGRDPAEIKHTLLMPLKVTDDKAEAERFIVGLGGRTMERWGNYGGTWMEPRVSGSMAGPLNHVIDRIGQFVDAGVDEIMFAAIPTGNVEAFQRVEEEIVAVFD